MSFTIIGKLEQPPSYAMLCRLADQNNVGVMGNERTGTFSGPGVEGDYEFREDGLHGRTTTLGVTAEFFFEAGKASVTIIKKPFWLPETLLRQKIAEGMDTLGKELARVRSV